MIVLIICFFFFFQAEDGIRYLVRSRGLGDVYKRQDVDDESILYAISSEKFLLKGLLVNGYGVSADALTQEMISKLSESSNP